MNKTNDYDSYAEKLAQLLRSGVQKPNAFIERPAMQALLPNLEGKRVLCVGCGTGEECGDLMNRGANVDGFDVSEKSVELARKAFPEANLQVHDMHDLSAYEAGQYDFIFSSLTLHYSEHPNAVFTELYRILKPGGQVQFSVLHPVKWGAEVKRDPGDESKKAFTMGYDTYQKPAHVYGNYLEVTKVIQKPQNYPEITYWNRPVSQYLRLIWDAGFQLLNFTEPQPAEDTKQVDPEYWEIHSKIPQFMIFVLGKK